MLKYAMLYHTIPVSSLLIINFKRFKSFDGKNSINCSRVSFPSERNMMKTCKYLSDLDRFSFHRMKREKKSMVYVCCIKDD